MSISKISYLFISAAIGLISGFITHFLVYTNFLNMYIIGLPFGISLSCLVYFISKNIEQNSIKVLRTFVFTIISCVAFICALIVVLTSTQFIGNSINITIDNITGFFLGGAIGSTILAIGIRLILKFPINSLKIIIIGISGGLFGVLGLYFFNETEFLFYPIWQTGVILVISGLILSKANVPSNLNINP